MHRAMLHRASHRRHAGVGRARRHRDIDPDRRDPPWWRFAHAPDASHRRSFAARPEASARVVCDARSKGGDEEIRRRGTCVLAAGVAWLIDDQFVASNSDLVAIAAEADNCKFHGGVTCR